jgi:hypothetical protein
VCRLQSFDGLNTYTGTRGKNIGRPSKGSSARSDLHPSDHARALDNGNISIVVGTNTINRTPFGAFCGRPEWFASRPDHFSVGVQKAMKFTSEEVMSLRSYTVTPTALSRRLFIGGSDVRVIVSREEVALVLLWHEQNVQMKSQRSLGVILKTPVVTSPDRQQRRLSICGPFGVSTRELLASDNGRPLQN